MPLSLSSETATQCYMRTYATRKQHSRKGLELPSDSTDTLNPVQRSQKSIFGPLTPNAAATRHQPKCWVRPAICIATRGRALSN
jgi:hypothetical protein